jgi:tripartite-type tricarboxylate transporter receptor subunit TctC
MKRRIAILAAAAFLGAALSCSALAQGAFPSRPIHLLVGFPPGGPVDALARAVGDKLAQSMGQPVVVENIPGATGIVANQRLARAAPDGYTLVMGASTIPIQATLRKSLPYDTLRDFTPIAYVGDSPYLLVVPIASPAHSVADLVKLVKAAPEKMSYGSAGTGSANHLSGELLRKMAGLQNTHVPYKGAAPAEVDVIGGHVAYIFDAFTTGLQQVQAGRLRALAVTTEVRSPLAPEIPTMIESGFPGFTVVGWYGVLGPANMPADVVTRLNEEVNKALVQPELQAHLRAFGLQARPQAPAQFSAFLRQEVAKWAAVIKDAGVPQED